MQVRYYEHPIKSGARKILREFLLFWIAVAVAIMVFTLSLAGGCYAAGHYIEGCYPSTLLLGFVYGLPLSLVLWFLYRLTRFAIGR